MGKDFNNADKGKTFKQGGHMATKKMNPFTKFEKSSKDVEKKGVKEGSKKDMMMDKKQMAMPKQSKDNVGMGVKYSPKPEQATAAMKKGGMAMAKKYASGGSVASTATVNAGKKQSMNYDTKQGKSVSASAAMPRKMPKVNTNPGNINGVAKYGKTQGKTISMSGSTKR